MSLRRLVVLGGSSPFTAALIDALAARGTAISPYELVLQGRNQAALNVVAKYARYQLCGAGWRVSAWTDIRQALGGAAIVLHQIRYGGLEGRAEGEALCAQLGVVADETLGPAALLTGLRTAAEVAATGDLLARHAPDAMVLNLTNPLSATTALLLDWGVRHCLGLCELPAVTAEQACLALGVQPQSASFNYVGLNHRGFLCDLKAAGDELIPELVARGLTIGGIDAQTMSELNALPLKYYAAYTASGVPQTTNRAVQLGDLRQRLLDELLDTHAGTPPSLAERYLEWYPKSVVPVIEALGSTTPTPHIVNALCKDPQDPRCGLVVEGMAAISNSGVVLENTPTSAVSPGVACWHQRFWFHERAFVAALREASRARCEAALALDPLVPQSVHSRATAELTRRLGL